MLNCECKYYVHYRCYKKWWKENQNCIICLKYADEPYSYNSFENKNDYRELLKLNNNLKEIESFFDNHVIVKHKKLHGFIYFLTYTSFIIYNVPFIFYFIFAFFYTIFIMLP